MIIAVKQILVTGTYTLYLYRRHRELMKSCHLIATADPDNAWNNGSPQPHPPSPASPPPLCIKCISNITYAKWPVGHLTIPQGQTGLRGN